MVPQNLRRYVAMGVLATPMHGVSGRRIFLGGLTASASFCCLLDFPVHSWPPDVASSQNLHSYDSRVALIELPGT